MVRFKELEEIERKGRFKLVFQKMLASDKLNDNVKERVKDLLEPVNLAAFVAVVGVFTAIEVSPVSPVVTVCAAALGYLLLGLQVFEITADLTEAIVLTMNASDYTQIDEAAQKLAAALGAIAIALAITAVTYGAGKGAKKVAKSVEEAIADFKQIRGKVVLKPPSSEPIIVREPVPETPRVPEPPPVDAPKTPYVNRNPRADAGEIKLGEMLHGDAQGGSLKGVKSVEGAAESGVKGQRSGDYRFTLDDGRVVSADRYAPESGRIENIAVSVIRKSGQAEIVVIEFGAGKTAGFGATEAGQIADHLATTPGHSIKRLIVVKDGKILLDR
jgi:hypothetical protein